MTVFLLAGIVCICIFICSAEGLARLWEKIEAAAERREKRVQEGETVCRK